MADDGEYWDDESDAMEEVGDNVRSGGGVKLSGLRSGSNGELDGET
jgi:hypothetical protein